MRPVVVLFALALLAMAPQAAGADVEHTARAGEPVFDTGVIPANLTGEITVPSGDGDLDYHCHPHPWMRAVLHLSAAAPTRVTVTLQKYNFTPARIDVRPGGKVVFANLDPVAHTATSDARPPDGTVLPATPWLFAVTVVFLTASGLRRRK